MSLKDDATRDVASVIPFIVSYFYCIVCSMAIVHKNCSIISPLFRLEAYVKAFVVIVLHLKVFHHVLKDSVAFFCSKVGDCNFQYKLFPPSIRTSNVWLKILIAILR